MAHRVWILGAPDPEMEAIESLLRECGETVIYATDGDGKRVHPGNAYRCPVPAVPEGSTVYAVECIDTLPDGWVRVDHHRPGDPGYGRPPEDFIAASSIGQVLSILAHTPVATRRDMIVLGNHPKLSRCLLTGDISSTNLHTDWHLEGFGTFRDSHSWSSPDAGNRVAKQILNNTKMFCFADGDWYTCPYLGSEDRDLNAQYFTVLRVPTHILLIAAADHCLAAAYAGECPGVDPEALMQWRVSTRAAFQGRQVNDVLADVERARELLLEDPDTVELAPGIRVADVRGYCVVTHDCGSKELEHEDYMDHISHKHGCPGSPYEPRRWCNGWLVEPGVPELPEAASREGVAYLATVSDRDGRRRVVLGGNASPETVRAFMEHWAPAQGFVDIYGDPARGFAGGYTTRPDDERASA